MAFREKTAERIARKYEHVRSSPIRFLSAAGHHAAEHAEVIERRDGYEIAEKRGETAMLAAERNPRS
ncbi:MAG TPA: hypothetical protein VHH55_02960 [Gaiellaceae bacterium]|jgi:hypothetical protein|nr:hypothetical protein [Gaiellaceae bacterium]